MRRPLLWLLLWLGATSAFAPLRPPSRALSPAAPRATVSEPQVLQEEVDRVVQIAPNAMAHLRDMKSKLSKEVLHVRMGVRSGGCSGMSYVMDLMDPADLTEDDHIEEWDGEGIRCAIDPKSLLYLFGLVLDYSDELIGGGFSFSNPNADTTCGCGKSFSV